jgi:primosomal protein N'
MTCDVAIFGFTLKPIPYTYTIPSNSVVQPGQLVEVPFGKKRSKGIVISTSEKTESMFNLKQITKVLSPHPLLTASQLELATWISKTYFTPLAKSIELFLPTAIQEIPPDKDHQYQELVIFPTISQALSAYKSYPGLIYGSHLTRKKLDQAWKQVHSGKARTIIGTRSALFAPFQNLKKITIFQTESDLYKNERHPYYRALTVAAKLAELSGAKLKAISYSPRIQDHYTIHHTIKKITQPFSYQVIDLKRMPIINGRLLETLRGANPQRTLVFLNRKSDHGYLNCQTCKEVSYTNDPTICPNCQSADVRFKVINLSTTSKKILKETGKDFTFATQQVFFDLESSSRFDLIVVLSADTYLHLNSFNAGEKTFQTITSLTRLLRPQGRIIVQTAFPKLTAIKSSLQANYGHFYDEEVGARREVNYPPFTELAKLTYRSLESQTPDKPNLPSDVEVLGPFNNTYPYFAVRGQNLEALESLTRPWVLDIDPLSI